jgi:hypothetical protein
MSVPSLRRTVSNLAAMHHSRDTLIFSHGNEPHATPAGGGQQDEPLQPPRGIAPSLRSESIIMSILVTGSTGRIGAQVVTQLAASGASVLGVCAAEAARTPSG